MDEKKEQTYDGRGNVLLSAKYKNRKKEEADDVFGLIPEENEMAAEIEEPSSPAEKKRLKKEIMPGDMALSSGMAQEAGRQTVGLNRLNAEQGAGYAAEMANDLLDRMHGRNAVIVGNDNATNGADRWVDGQLIQTKYYETPEKTLNAAFEVKNGVYKYRYIGKNEKLMQLEVPSDQYDEIYQILKQRIKSGKITNIKKTEDAGKLLRKGRIEYKTSKNIAEAGNIDSLLFDSANGAIIGLSALGISGAIVFAKAIWDGEDVQQAMDEALVSGLQAGGVGFASYVLSAQLFRTNAAKLLQAPARAAVDLLPRGSSKKMLPALRGGNAAQTVNKDMLATAIRSQVIAAAATVLVMSSGDIINCFRGRISGKQLFKNMTILSGSVGSGLLGGAGGAYAGAALGMAIAGPAGMAIGAKVGAVMGGMTGGAAGGSATKAAMDALIEDDAVQMVRILESRIVPLVQSYLLSEEELSIVLDDLQRELIQDKLMDMYASDDREAFADDLLTTLIRRVVGFRVRVKVPRGQAAAQSLGRILARTAAGKSALLPRKKADPQAVALAVLGREVSKPAAKKAWYATKQMHIVTKQQEGDLLEMKDAEARHAETMRALREKRAQAMEAVKHWTEEDK